MGQQLSVQHSPEGETPARVPHSLRLQGTRVHSQLACIANGDVRVRLFEGLERTEIHGILTAASYRYFSHQSVVTHQEEPADRLFLLLRGSARFFFLTPDGKKVYLHWLTHGEIFGAASLLTEATKFIVSTEVAKDTHVLMWRKNVMRSLVKSYPRLLENALSVACDYLVWYLASHLSLVAYTAGERLANVLIGLAEGMGSEVSGGIQLDITNEQLANTANISLFTVSRLLSDFHRRGVIRKRRGKIVISRPERLLEAARTRDPKEP